MVQWINAGGTETKTEKTAFWRCQCFAPAVSAVACLISGWGLNQPHHTPNAALLRGRWHRQKDKNHSPSAKNPVGTWYFESTEKVLFFKDQNEKCLRFITFLSTNRLNKAMIGRKRRVKRQFLRYKLSIWKLVLLFQCSRYFTSAHDAVLYWMSIIWCGREVSRPYHAKSFWDSTTSF